MNQLSDAALQAYQNSRDLLEEAIVLDKNGMFPRAYFLAVTSAEQFTRSVEYACESVGFKFKDKTPNDGLHDFRLKRFARLAISSHAMSVEGWNFFAKLTKDAPLKSYGTSLLEAFYKNFEGNVGGKRNHSLYVELQDGRLSTPRHELTASDSKAMIGIVDQVIQPKPDYLSLSGEHLKSNLAMRYAPLLRLGGDDSKKKERELTEVIAKRCLSMKSSQPQPFNREKSEKV
ncbi:MAG: AbiV family abortive infection protein [Nitrososphaerales archaeon]|jgi:AbiV family abortive infection protein